jgi:hypothetical protein
MSFDPFGHVPEPGSQPDRPPAPSSPPGGPAPGPGAANPAVERVKLPAVFLIVCGILDLLIALLPAFGIITTVTASDEEFEERLKQSSEMMEKLFPGAKKQIEVEGKKGPEAFKRQATLQYGGAVAVWLIVGLLLIAGGIRMLQLRSYGLCMLASVTAAIPCISILGCCGVGQLVGIWSVVVLLAPDVRAAFR